jgi:hypothetical protein
MEKNYAKKIVLSEKYVNLKALQKEKPSLVAEGFC